MGNDKLKLGLNDQCDMDFGNINPEKSFVTNSNEPSQNYTNPLKVNSEDKKNNQENVFYDNFDELDFSSNVNIKIFGLGGAGNNMVAHIAESTNIDPNCLYAINTDFQFLKRLPKKFNRLLIGKTITKGMGSGSDPKVGKDAALEDADLIREKLKNTDLLFIVSGMGKGTGTGASPVVAQIAKEMGILTICVVNLPSITTEGKLIYNKGMAGLEELQKYADGVSTISNEKIINSMGGNEELSLRESFSLANDLISTIVFEIVNIVNLPVEMNIDFNDIKTFFKEKSRFQINNFTFLSDENVKEIISNKIKNAVYQDEHFTASKAIINFRLNPKVPKQFFNTVRQVLEEVLDNKDLTLSYSIDYLEDIEFANFTLLIATKILDEPSKTTSLSANDVVDNVALPKNPTLDELEEMQNTSSTFEHDNEQNRVHNFNWEELDLRQDERIEENNRNVASFYNDDDSSYKRTGSPFRKEVKEMGEFVNNNLNKDSLGYLDSFQNDFNNLSDNNHNNPHSDATNAYNSVLNTQRKTTPFTKDVNSLLDDFKELQQEVELTSRQTNPHQTITVTRQIKEFEQPRSNSFNSTSLNRFFTKTLKFGCFNTKEHKNDDKN